VTKNHFTKTPQIPIHDDLQKISTPLIDLPIDNDTFAHLRLP